MLMHMSGFSIAQNVSLLLLELLKETQALLNNRSNRSSFSSLINCKPSLTYILNWLHQHYRPAVNVLHSRLTVCPINQTWHLRWACRLYNCHDGSLDQCHCWSNLLIRVSQLSEMLDTLVGYNVSELRHPLVVIFGLVVWPVATLLKHNALIC